MQTLPTSFRLPRLLMRPLTGEKGLDALQAGEHSALDADLMLVRTDAIVCVQPPPVARLAVFRESPGGQFHSLVKNL